MRKYRALISDANSVILALGILLFYLGSAGYTPVGDNAVLMGIATVVIIMVVYTAIEGIVVLRETTATPLQFAIETMFSYFPALALTWVLAAWYYGQIAVSNFQWITGAIIAVFLLMDLLGFTAALAQRLHLTDEFRTQK